MLYYLFEYLENQYQFPGASLFQFITFRAAMAIILSLLISTIYGKRIIAFLQKKQMGETIRELGLEGQAQKAGTPTMGGVIIILSTLVPVLLFARLDNIYVLLLIVTTIWMGIIGFTDDFLKIKRKDKEGSHFTSTRRPGRPGRRGGRGARRTGGATTAGRCPATRRSWGHSGGRAAPLRWRPSPRPAATRPRAA